MKDSRFLSPVTLRQCGGIYDKAKGPWQSRFLETPSSTGIPVCLTSLYESVRFVLFKATFHAGHKNPLYVTPPLSVSGFSRARVSYLRHHGVIIFYLAGGSVSLFICSQLKKYHNHSHLPSFTETHAPLYPNFSARIPSLFLRQRLSVHTIFPCHLSSYPLEGFCLPLVFPAHGSLDPNVLMLRTLCSLFLYERLYALFFLFNSGSPHLLPSLPPGLGSYPFLTVLKGFFSVWERNYSECGCVPAVLKGQTERMDEHCYLGRC